MSCAGKREEERSRKQWGGPFVQVGSPRHVSTNHVSSRATCHSPPSPRPAVSVIRSSKERGKLNKEPEGQLLLSGSAGSGFGISCFGYSLGEKRAELGRGIFVSRGEEKRKRAVVCAAAARSLSAPLSPYTSTLFSHSFLTPSSDPKPCPFLPPGKGWCPFPLLPLPLRHRRLMGRRGGRMTSAYVHPPILSFVLFFVSGGSKRQKKEMKILRPTTTICR